MKNHFAVLSIFLLIILLFPAGPAQAQCKLRVPVIKVGVQGVASGPHADYGRQILMGATMAIEEINRRGGILGCKVGIKFMDDENKAATGVKNARYLVTDWGAHFTVGTDDELIHQSAAAPPPMHSLASRAFCQRRHGHDDTVTPNVMHQRYCAAALPAPLSPTSENGAQNAGCA